ncbi:MAG: aconitase X catalytic domain-containing protein [Actinobacteria bacterium]|nr:aconitase X catalytic domain-containing protein [Actinomycetota bacterium]
MLSLEFDRRDRDVIEGGKGEAARLAMRIIVALARVNGAPRLIDVTRAHIDGCLYHGQAGLDFARRLLADGGRVTIPTTLNVSSLDLLHPDLVGGDPATRARARELMDAYVAMGCEPTWTCAPYQLPERPELGEQIAWAESNAIVFANSVLGARTNRYGDFVDICAAITGRVPDSGLHRDVNRRAEVVFRLQDIPERLLDEDVFYPVLGHHLGRATGSAVPVIVGLPPGQSEDRLKALGTAAASSGSVAMFHAVGSTPEAATLDDALKGAEPRRVADITPDDITRARDSLTSTAGDVIEGVSLGTPHLSLAGFARLIDLLDGAQVHPSVEFYVSTGRGTLGQVRANGWVDRLEDAGVEIVVDTCTYITPILRRAQVVMTDSGKWAYYAPGNIGVEVVFGSTRECVLSAVEGRVIRDPELWAGL